MTGREEQPFPFVESEVDYDGLTSEQQKIVDTWSEGVVELLIDFEADQQRMRNLYGPGYGDSTHLP